MEGVCCLVTTSKVVNLSVVSREENGVLSHAQQLVHF